MAALYACCSKALTFEGAPSHNKLAASLPRHWAVKFVFKILGVWGKIACLSVTYIVPPANFVYPGIRLDVALEEHIDALAQRGVQRIGSQLQTHHRYVCGWKGRQNWIEVITGKSYGDRDLFGDEGKNRLCCHGIVGG